MLRRRRRAATAVLSAVLVALAVVVVLLVGPGAAAAPGAGAGPSDDVVAVVGAGESLRDVARRIAPGADEGELAARIREANDLPSSAVAPGRPLVVPAVGGS